MALSGCAPFSFDVKKIESVSPRLETSPNGWQLNVAEEGFKGLSIKGINIRSSRNDLGDNAFEAAYTLQDGSRLEVKLLFPDTFYAYKKIMLNPFLPLPFPFKWFMWEFYEIYCPDHQHMLWESYEYHYQAIQQPWRRKPKGRVALLFNAADVDFDKTRAFFILSNGRKIPGHDLGVRRKADDLYNLADTAGLQGRYHPQTYADFPLTEEEQQSLFILTFPLTCPDYEDSLFVLEGLSHKGEPLPPLRLRLNYSAASYELLTQDNPEAWGYRHSLDEITVPARFRDKVQSYAEQFRQALDACADTSCFMQYLPIEFPAYSPHLNLEYKINYRSPEFSFLSRGYDRFNGQDTMTWRYIVPISKDFRIKDLEYDYLYKKLHGSTFLQCRLQVNFDEHNQKISHEWLDKACELF